MPYDTINSDDAQNILYGSSPKTNITVQPVEQENFAVEPPKVKVKKENKEIGVIPPSLAQQVTNTMDVLTANTPMPTPSSPIPQAINTYSDLLKSVGDNWMTVAIPALAYGAYKLGKHVESGQPKPADPTTPISQRQIIKIEPQMDVNQTSQARVEPTFKEPTNLTSTNELSSEVLNSPGYQKFTELEAKTGGLITNASDLALVVKSEKNRISKEQEFLKKAEQAGVTPSTSDPEAQTLVTSHEDALTPTEKLEEKVTEIKSTTDSVKPRRPELVGPVKPVEIPEDRIPNYMEYKIKKNGERVYKNRKDEDVIGKGAYNWLQGQWGPEKTQQIYEEAFGKKNVTYEEMQKAKQEGKLPVPNKNELGHGGSFPREPHVPNYIKGNASLGAMAGTGFMAALMALAGSEKGQQAMSKASNAIKDLGISPDIFTNKGEELGNLGTSYITAGNPSYQKELLQQLQITKNPQERNLLLKELQKLPISGSSVPPPNMGRR